MRVRQNGSDNGKSEGILYTKKAAMLSVEKSNVQQRNRDERNSIEEMLDGFFGRLQNLTQRITAMRAF